MYVAIVSDTQAPFERPADPGDKADGEMCRLMYWCNIPGIIYTTIFDDVRVTF